jgi:hypothetical protein
VAEGQGKATDIGELNQTVADRLELALILKVDLKAPLGVIRTATCVAEKTAGADHTTSPGREKLFAARYPLAWGSEQVQADAFLTGVARLQPDRSLNVSVFVVTPRAQTEKVAEFQAAADVATLMESGGSFTSRGLFQGGKFSIEPEEQQRREETVRKEAVEVASKVRKEPEQHPANPTTEPSVLVRILYDGREQKVEFRDGDAWVAEPREGSKVELVVDCNLKAGSGPVGLVLKVNGENTIEKQRLRDPECRKWILQPGSRFVIPGFLQPGGQKSEPFRVLSARESAVQAFRYGPEVGTLSWSVFRGEGLDNKTQGPAVLKYEQVDQDAEALKPPATLAAFRMAFSRPRGPERGLIVEDKTRVVDTPTRTVEFRSDPVPILHATVRYYRVHR